MRISTGVATDGAKAEIFDRPSSCEVRETFSPNIARTSSQAVFSASSCETDFDFHQVQRNGADLFRRHVSKKPWQMELDGGNAYLEERILNLNSSPTNFDTGM